MSSQTGKYVPNPHKEQPVKENYTEQNIRLIKAYTHDEVCEAQLAHTLSKLPSEHKITLQLYEIEDVIDGLTFTAVQGREIGRLLHAFIKQEMGKE